MKSKKLLTWVIVAVVLIAAAVGLYFVSSGTSADNTPDTGDTITFGLTVTVGGETVIYDEDIEIVEGTALIDAMCANITEDGGVVYSTGEFGAYITSICGYAENYENNEYWVYTVNGESAMEGASDFTPAEGDEVVFDLSELVW